MSGCYDGDDVTFQDCIFYPTTLIYCPLLPHPHPPILHQHLGRPGTDPEEPCIAILHMYTLLDHIWYYLNCTFKSYVFSYVFVYFLRIKILDTVHISVK